MNEETKESDVGKDLANWEELKAEVDRLRTKHNSYDNHPLLFRGQADAQWKLETTLERNAHATEYSLIDYYGIICQIQSQVETVTGKTWNFPEYVEFVNWLGNATTPEFMKPLPANEFMVYLRHHGFPSPLLDWTSSLEIATFFAFQKLSKDVEKISIFVYKEFGESGKSITDGQTAIFSWGPNIKSHPRHFLQKSQYTICIKPERINNFNKSVSYTSHHDIFSQERTVVGQDYLWKFNLPVSEREKVLRILEDVNINSYSLFATEEGLMDTLAVKKFVLASRY